MAGDAVIIDDGGSTRIKQIKGPGANGKLDELLDQLKDFAKGPLQQIRIVCVDKAGTAASPDLNGSPAPGGTFPIALGNNDTFKIHSGNHRVEGRIVNRSASGGSVADCQLTVSGVSGIDPILEARTSKGQRRYIVSNAPSIEKVDVNAAGPPVTFTIPNGTVYTVVIVD